MSRSRRSMTLPVPLPRSTKDHVSSRTSSSANPPEGATAFWELSSHLRAVPESGPRQLCPPSNNNGGILQSSPEGTPTGENLTPGIGIINSRRSDHEVTRPHGLVPTTTSAVANLRRQRDQGLCLPKECTPSRRYEHLGLHPDETNCHSSQCAPTPKGNVESLGRTTQCHASASASPRTGVSDNSVPWDDFTRTPRVLTPPASPPQSPKAATTRPPSRAQPYPSTRFRNFPPAAFNAVDYLAKRPAAPSTPPTYAEAVRVNIQPVPIHTDVPAKPKETPSKSSTPANSTSARHVNAPVLHSPRRPAVRSKRTATPVSPDRTGFRSGISVKAAKNHSLHAKHQLRNQVRQIAMSVFQDVKADKERREKKQMSSALRMAAHQRPPGDCICRTPLSRSDPNNLVNWAFYLLSVALILNGIPRAAAGRTDPLALLLTGLPVTSLSSGYRETGTVSVLSVGEAFVDTFIDNTSLPLAFVNTSLPPWNLPEPSSPSEWGDFIFHLCLKSGLLTEDKCALHWDTLGDNPTPNGFNGFHHEINITFHDDMERILLYLIRMEHEGHNITTTALKMDQSEKDQLTWEVWNRLRTLFKGDKLPSLITTKHQIKYIRPYCEHKCLLKYCRNTNLEKHHDPDQETPTMMTCGIAFRACYINCAGTPYLEQKEWEIIKPIDFGFDDLDIHSVKEAKRPSPDSVMAPPGPLVHNPLNFTDMGEIVEFNYRLIRLVREHQTKFRFPRFADYYHEDSQPVDDARTRVNDTLTFQGRSVSKPPEPRVIREIRQQHQDSPLHRLDQALNQQPLVPESEGRHKRSLTDVTIERPPNVTSEELDRAVMAYDCSKPQSIQSVQVPLNMNKCHQYEDPVTQRNQSYILLQEAQTYPIKVIRCSMKTSILPTGCGMWSHAWVLHPWVEIEREERLSPSACRTYWDTQQFVDRHDQIHPLRRNSVNRIFFMDAGTVQPSENGYCTPGEVRRDGQVLTNVVQSRHSTLVLEEIEAQVDSDNNLQLNEGLILRCKANALRCIGRSGTYIWELPTQDKLCPLYRTRTTHGIVSVSPQGQRIFISQDSTMIRLVMEDQLYRCGGLVVKTGYDNLYLTEDTDNEYFKRELPFREYSIITYSNQQDGFLYGYLTDKIKQEHREVARQNCERRNSFRSMDYGTLLAEQTIPVEGSIAHIGAGWFVSSAGDAYYKFQCRPIQVQAANTPYCYSALKVDLSPEDLTRYRNNLGLPSNQSIDFFVSPISHLLTEVGIRQTCNPRLPPKYLGAFGQWITHTAGAPVIARNPELLTLSEEEIKESTFEDFNFQTGGIYDPTNAALMEKVRAAGRAIMDGLQYFGDVIRQGNDVTEPRKIIQSLHESISERLVAIGSLSILSNFLSSLKSAWITWGDFCAGLIGLYCAIYLFLQTVHFLLQCYGIQFSWRNAFQTWLTSIRHPNRPAHYDAVNPDPPAPSRPPSPPYPSAPPESSSRPVTLELRDSAASFPRPLSKIKEEIQAMENDLQDSDRSSHLPSLTLPSMSNRGSYDVRHASRARTISGSSSTSMETHRFSQNSSPTLPIPMATLVDRTTEDYVPKNPELLNKDSLLLRATAIEFQIRQLGRSAIYPTISPALRTQKVDLEKVLQDLKCGNPDDLNFPRISLRLDRIDSRLKKIVTPPPPRRTIFRQNSLYQPPTSPILPSPNRHASFNALNDAHLDLLPPIDPEAVPGTSTPIEGRAPSLSELQDGVREASLPSANRGQ